ncbi:hypothetical protein GCM10010977_06860 [Citricoccus zhacaiensis]|uniref:DUF2238 domain-containing protein n=1 Tax=Citricoccus zhacaiensis TaxID=489142 RepID=A0ABQ2LS56_9MICC|nr:hypothetical protein [Citricoccus zhacaiensis]GGO42033.1 hypothetical protein GCM10010977_06860 [Citricoccus zhacaiensis]
MAAEANASPAARLWQEAVRTLRVDGPLPARLIADAAALLTLLSLVLGLWDSGVAVALYSLVLLGQTVIRLAPLRGSVQAGTAVILLVAAWAALLDAYQLIPWLDLVMHVVATGLLAAIGTAALLRSGWLQTGPSAGRAGQTLLTAGLGALLAVLWEVGEWFGHTLLDPAIQVGYEDTMGDLAAGVLGALLAGLLLDRLVKDGPWP